MLVAGKSVQAKNSQQKFIVTSQVNIEELTPAIDQHTLTLYVHYLSVDVLDSRANILIALFNLPDAEHERLLLLWILFIDESDAKIGE